MKAYMGFVGDPQDDGALLIFAHTAREAKKLFFQGWPGGVDDFTEVRVQWLRDRPWLFAEANKAKLVQDIPHTVDQPKSCGACETWGFKLGPDGLCDDCRENRREGDHNND